LSARVGVGAFNIPAGVTVKVTAQVDPGNVIVESNEANNTYTETFQT
jgi:subtilase family serine protease